MIEYNDFTKIDIRVGTIIEVRDFPEAKKPAYKLKIDFGQEIGVKNSSVQVVDNYTKDDLMNRSVVTVVNLSPKQIGPFLSEVLVLGVPDKDDNCVLLGVDKEVSDGGRIY